VHFRFSALKRCCLFRPTLLLFNFSVLTNINYLHCHGFISYQHAALTAQMKSNSETYPMMFSPIEWTLDWIGFDWIGFSKIDPCLTHSAKPPSNTNNFNNLSSVYMLSLLCPKPPTPTRLNSTVASRRRCVLDITRWMNIYEQHARANRYRLCLKSGTDWDNEDSPRRPWDMTGSVEDRRAECYVPGYNHQFVDIPSQRSAVACLSLHSRYTINIPLCCLLVTVHTVIIMYVCFLSWRVAFRRLSILK